MSQERRQPSDERGALQIVHADVDVEVLLDRHRHPRAVRGYSWLNIGSRLEREGLLASRPVHPDQKPGPPTIGSGADISEDAVARHAEESAAVARMSHAFDDNACLATRFHPIEIERHRKQRTGTGVYEVAARQIIRLNTTI